jgi:hypothetical protein
MCQCVGNRFPTISQRLRTFADYTMRHPGAKRTRRPVSLVEERETCEFSEGHGRKLLKTSRTGLFNVKI